MITDADDSITLNAQQVKQFLKNLKEEDLIKHYQFKEVIKCELTSKDDVLKFIKENHPLTMSVQNGDLYYNVTEGVQPDELFDIDTSSSFSASNVWLYPRIINIELVCPNISSAKISNEMVGLYTCLVVSSVLGGEFEEEFVANLETYDFKNWKQTDDDFLNFSKLSQEWVQMGSDTVKMIVASANFSISKNSKKKELPAQLSLPPDVASRFKQLQVQVSNIRYEFDEVKLSPSKRENLSKLEIKCLIAERDQAVEAAITSSSELHKIWKILSLNSNVIEPNMKRSFIRSSRKEAPNVFKSLYGREVDKELDDDLLILKKIQNKLKKEAIRACLNKRFSLEIEKFLENRETYIPPSFV